MAVSVRDVAIAAGVSVGTVSNVLNKPDKVAPETAERVTDAIRRLGFVRNDAARRLRVGRSSTIGLVVLDVGNPFFAAVVRGAERRADEAGLSVLVGNSDENAAREDGYLELFREQRVTGVLMTPASDDLRKLDRVAADGIRVILVDHEPPAGTFDSVSVDDIEGGYIAARHLLDTGRRRLAFLGGPGSLLQVAHRLAGASRAVAEVEGASLEVIDVPAMSVLNGRDAGERLVARAPARRPDAVFAANDLLAVGVLQALNMLHGLRVPEDIAVIGYDDIDFASATVVPLSSVRQPAEMLGYCAVDLLLRDDVDHAEDGSRRIRFQPELVVRASTAGAG